MRVILASPRGFCAGVNMAAGCLERALELFGPPLYVYHEIVHNKRVVDSFRRRGVIFVESLDEVPEGSRLLYSAHGVSPVVCRHAEYRHLQTFDATCPLVHKVHLEAARFARQGHSIARAQGVPAYLIDGAEEINPDWFQDAETVLMTAGASAPKEVIDRCLSYLVEHFGAEIDERVICEESAQFPLPRELRQETAGMAPTFSGVVLDSPMSVLN